MSSKLATTLGMRIVLASICFGYLTYSGTAPAQVIPAVQVKSEKPIKKLQQPLSNGFYYRPGNLSLLDVVDVYVFDDFEAQERWIVLQMHWSDQAGDLRKDLNFTILKLLVLPKRAHWAPNLTWNESGENTRSLISTKLLIKYLPAGIERLREYLDVVEPFPIPKQTSND